MITKTSLPRVDDEKVQRALDTLLTLVNKLPDVSILNGRLVKNIDVAVTANVTRVAHGLGRVPQGAIVIRADTVGAPVTVLGGDAKFLQVDANSTTNVDLWVF